MPEIRPQWADWCTFSRRMLPSCQVLIGQIAPRTPRPRPHCGLAIDRQPLAASVGTQSAPFQTAIVVVVDMVATVIMLALFTTQV